MLRHDYAEVNGVRLHYTSEGRGKLNSFLHGFPEFWYEWKNQLEEALSDIDLLPQKVAYRLDTLWGAPHMLS